MIEFLQDYTTEALPPESFKKGQQVERSAGSEDYFVGRGLAGYVVDGKLVDDHFRPIVTKTVEVEVVQPGDRRADLAFRAGEVMTGQPPRASSGPGVPFVEPAAGIAGSPAVVLEAEIERLKTALGTSEDLFRDMNNSHVTDKEGIRAENERLKQELSDANAEGDDAVAARDQAVADLAALREQHDKVTADYAELRQAADADATRIADLEQQLAAATKPKTTK
ncbi:hypothetical protein [Sphingomonas sp. 2SG]|uniref:hypothetical protein n=1 Tax=Sphingomonas sp. 2SG TaxID=2502201 RepID=UPI0010F5CB68|nr:hypothetical protein [Sphingomonas sp. 2SG]